MLFKTHFPIPKLGVYLIVLQATPKLLFRLPSNELNFTSHHHWKVKSFGSRAASNDEKTSTPASAQRGIGLTVLSTFKFICAPGYFGPLCAGQCDSGGNLLAAPECGSPQAQCRNGYRGEHCDMRESTHCMFKLQMGWNAFSPVNSLFSHLQPRMHKWGLRRTWNMQVRRQTIVYHVKWIA